jgi:hypothetical protein
MSLKVKRTFFHRVPAWGLSILTTIFSFILLFGLAALWEGLGIAGEHGELILNIVLFLFIAIVCYLICLIYPRSFWYVPILSNLITIIAAIVEPIQLTPDWFYVMAGWGLSIVAALIGAWVGKRNSTE